MKKLVFLFAVMFILGASSVFAQRGGQGNQGGGQRSGGMGNGGQQGPRQQGSDSAGNRPRQNGNQPSANSEGRAPRQEGLGNRALKNLGLSDEQKAQIKQIRKDAKTNNADPQAVRQQIEGVLTPEQLEKLKQQRNQQKP